VRGDFLLLHERGKQSVIVMNELRLRVAFLSLLLLNISAFNYSCGLSLYSCRFVELEVSHSSTCQAVASCGDSILLLYVFSSVVDEKVCCISVYLSSFVWSTKFIMLLLPDSMFLGFKFQHPIFICEGALVRKCLSSAVDAKASVFN
jgi:hypothetical protein